MSRWETNHSSKNKKKYSSTPVQKIYQFSTNLSNLDKSSSITAVNLWKITYPPININFFPLPTTTYQKWKIAFTLATSNLLQFCYLLVHARTHARAHAFNNIKDKHIFKTRKLHGQKCRVIIFLYIVPSYLCQPRGHPSICLLKSSNRFEGAAYASAIIHSVATGPP